MRESSSRKGLKRCFHSSLRPLSSYWFLLHCHCSAGWKWLSTEMMYHGNYGFQLLKQVQDCLKVVSYCCSTSLTQICFLCLSLLLQRFSSKLRCRCNELNYSVDFEVYWGGTCIRQAPYSPFPATSINSAAHIPSSFCIKSLWYHHSIPYSRQQSLQNWGQAWVCGNFDHCYCDEGLCLFVPISFWRRKAAF